MTTSRFNTLTRCSLKLCAWTACGCLLVTFFSPNAKAQIVRRYAGGGVQIRAPFVRVNVGPGGTSVRAPFTSINTSGTGYIGRRRWLAGQPAPVQRPAPLTRQATPAPTPQPTPVHVDDLAYPTPAQLAAMDDVQLVETLRQMMARFHYRLSLLNTGAGWQKHLVLSRELLGSPGTAPTTVRVEAIEAFLPRFQRVLENPQYVKISSLPSFGATFAALQATQHRLNQAPVAPGAQTQEQQTAGPQLFQSGSVQPASLNIETTPAATPTNTPQDTPAEKATETLPRPVPAELPNVERGERSILKTVKRS